MRYPHVNPLIALKAVNYFEDIDEALDPPMMIHPVAVADIKERISQATLNSKVIFSEKS